MDGKFSVGYRDAVVRTVVSLDRETTASYTLVLEAIGRDHPMAHHQHSCSGLNSCRVPFQGPARP